MIEHQDIKTTFSSATCSRGAVWIWRSNQAAKDHTPSNVVVLARLLLTLPPLLLLLLLLLQVCSP